MVYHELLLALAGCPGDLFVETDGGEIEVRVFALYKDVCVCVMLHLFIFNIISKKL